MTNNISQIRKLNEHLMNPRKCLNIREKGKQMYSQTQTILTITQISSFISCPLPCWWCHTGSPNSNLTTSEGLQYIFSPLSAIAHIPEFFFSLLWPKLPNWHTHTHTPLPYLAHPHQSSIQIRGTGPQKHGYKSHSFAQKYPVFSIICSTWPDSSAWLSVWGLTTVPAASSTLHQCVL